MNAVPEVAPQSAPTPPLSRELPLEFRATGGEYFRIWIVNLLLTIVTVGIYSAWAKVRRLRYFYGSTSLDGSSFEYHGRPIAILKGRLIALAAYLVFAISTQIAPLLAIVLAPVIIFGVPWIIMKARLFQMRMTSWRGLRLNFHGTYGGALGAYIGWLLLAAITLGAVYPIALWKQVNYLIANGAYGTQRFAFLTTKGAFYRFCLLTVAIAIGAFCVVLIVAALAVGLGAGLQALSPDQEPAEAMRALIGGGMLISILVYGAAIMLVAAYFRASMVNASIGGTQIGPHRLYSRLSTWPLFGILLTNLLGMIVTLGLFYPWAKVRAMRYQLAHTGVIAAGDLNQFIAASGTTTDAVGEEISDFFDIDFGF